jgi:hypothetical protein
MVDSETRERVLVHNEGSGGPYIMLPFDQVADIEQILRGNEISFWVDADAISVDGKAAISVINLGRDADVNRVQQLVDAAV